jgi:hypothetical protein
MPAPTAITISTSTATWRLALESDKLDKILKKRTAVVNEILDTEVSYLGQLGIMMNLFVNPLKDLKMGLTKTDVFNLFANVEVIRDCHERL